MLPGVPARRAFRTPQFVALFLGVVLFGMVPALKASEPDPVEALRYE